MGRTVLRVKDMTADQKVAHKLMSVARREYVAGLDMGHDAVMGRFERYLVAALVNPVMRANGENWYVAARMLSSKIASQTGLSLEQVAGIIAVMSPSVKWESQEKYTPLFCRHVVDRMPGRAPGGAYGANYAKAFDIALGGDPYVLCNGPKVNPFMWAILGDETQIVLDVQMSRGACGVDVDSDTAALVLERKGVRDIMLDCIRHLSAKYGITPAIVQALIWLAVKAENEAARPSDLALVTFRFEDYM